jgi:hypothetical protein
MRPLTGGGTCGRNLWMGLAEQHSFMSDVELAKQIEVIGRIHSDLGGA